MKMVHHEVRRYRDQTFGRFEDRDSRVVMEISQELADEIVELLEALGKDGVALRSESGTLTVYSVESRRGETKDYLFFKQEV